MEEGGRRKKRKGREGSVLRWQGDRRGHEHQLRAQEQVKENLLGT